MHTASIIRDCRSLNDVSSLTLPKTEDMARGMIRFKNGASLILETAFAANVDPSEEVNITLMGDKGGTDLFLFTIYQEKHETPPAHLPEINYHERVSPAPAPVHPS